MHGFMQSSRGQTLKNPIGERRLPINYIVGIENNPANSWSSLHQ